MSNDRWSPRKTLLFIAFFCAGAWIAVAFIIGQVFRW